jgi:cell pole-organizing protein PopZ
MEDILASIRRIIADDQSQSGKSEHGTMPRRPQLGAALPSTVEGHREATAGAPYEDVLDLARLPDASEAEMQQRPAESVHVHAPEAVIEDQEEVQGSAADLMAEIDHAQHGNGHMAEAAGSSLRAHLSEAAAHASPANAGHERHDGLALGEDDALLAGPLGASVLSAFETLAATVVLENELLLERVMRDLLRPMLKTWLDDNLPALVERLVRTEIERVARGGRS